jgi:hypothetical protein
MSFEISSYSRADGRNNSVVEVRQRVMSGPLLLNYREKENGPRQDRAVVRMSPRIRRPSNTISGKEGHMKKHCRKRLDDQKTNWGGIQQRAHVTEHT